MLVIQNPVQTLKKYAFQKITHVTVGIFEVLNFALLNNKVLRIMSRKNSKYLIATGQQSTFKS